MYILAILATAAGHLLTDYVLQKTRLGIFKRKKTLGLLLHALLWTAGVSPGLFILGIFSPWKAVFLFVTHGLIDYTKMKLTGGSLTLFHPVNIIDQLLHLLTIIITFIT